LKESSLARGTDAELWYYFGMAQFQAKDLCAGRQSLQKSLDLVLPADLAVQIRKALDGKKWSEKRHAAPRTDELAIALSPGSRLYHN
jgi:hypothetical protein